MLDIEKPNGLCCKISTISGTTDAEIRDVSDKKEEEKGIIMALKMSKLDLVCVGVAEFVGTALLVFLGCMGCMSSLAGSAIPHAQISFSFGFAVMYIIQIFGHISGAHLNPAVTVTAVIMGLVTPLLSGIYVVAQILGGIVGFGLLKAVTPSQFFDAKVYVDSVTNQTMKEIGVCSTVPNPNISSLQALVVEIMLSLILMLVCCSVWDHRNATKHDSVPIKFGLTIAGLAMVGGSYTGASMNPARSFGPSLINGDWGSHWVYWLGPVLAAVLAGGGYRALFAREPPAPETPGVEDIPLTNSDKQARRA